MKRATLLAVVLGSAVVFLESSIVAVALPKIGRELPSTVVRTLEAQAYVYYGYLLALSALLVLAGALNDFYGRKKMFSFGLVAFGVTSALCAVAPSMELLIAARVLQGASGAVLVPGSLSIITATFEGKEQARAFGVWAGASAATTILGPVIGGGLVAYISWSAAFWINLPVVALALWLTLAYMQETKDEEATGRVDWSGAVVVALAVGGLTFGAIRGQAQQWNDPVAFMSLGIGVVAAAAFPFAMARSDHPLVPLELFRSRNFTVTNLSTLLIYGAIYVLIQYATLFAVGVLGYNEMGIGAATIPATLFLALFSTRFGALADRHGPRAFMAAGPALMGLGLLWLVRVPSDSAPWAIELRDPATFVPSVGYVADLFPAFALFGIGVMVMVAPLTTALMRSVPVRHAGVASAVNNAISRVGPQLVGALLFVAISATFYSTLGEALPGLDTRSRALRENVSPLNPPNATITRDVGGAETDARGGVRAPIGAGELRRAANDASTDAFQIAMLISALMCFAGAAVNALWIRNPAAERDEPKATPVTSSPHLPPVESPLPPR